MENITIDEEFKGLLPKLDKETLKLLEESILENGCRDSLVLWGNILVDGHNRHAICTRLGVPFNTVNKDFASREDAIIWIITNQISRRNLTPTRLSYYRGLHYRANKKIQGTYKRDAWIKKSQNGTFQVPTAQRLADQYDVSRNTIMRDEKNADAIDTIGEASPEARRMILDKEVKIDKKDLIAITAMSKEEIAEIAAQIEEGIYEKKKPEQSAAAGGVSASSDPNAPGTATPGLSTADSFAPYPTAPGSTDLMSPYAVALKVADDFVYYSGLQESKFDGDTSELESALRIYIDMLENLLDRLNSIKHLNF